MGHGACFNLKRAMKKTATMAMLLFIGLSIGATPVQVAANITDVARAIATGDINALKTILKLSPAVVKARDDDGRTPLHYCGERPHLYMKWAGKKARSFEQDNEKWLANGKAMAELLLSYGADVNATDVFSRTPLHYASSTGNIEVAKVLLANRADVNAKDRSYSSTALHLSALSGNTSMAKLLIENGADVNAKDKFGTPLTTAFGNRDMVALLLNNKADVEMKDEDGFAPLHLAEDKETAQLLLAHGAKLDTTGYAGRTPLHQSAMRNRNDMVEWLCSKGAHVNALDSEGQTPLIISLSQLGYNIDTKTRTDTVRILLNHGADLSCRDKSRDKKGWTLLHYAIRESNEDIVDLLLKRGMDINAKDKYGYTPLHWAVTNKDKKMVELLVSRGADVNARNLQGNTPLYDTWGGSDVDHQIAEILQNHGGRR
jgi:ankyrin repeat protein